MLTSSAQGFLPVGGYQGRTHYAVEPLTAGYAAGSSTVVSVGFIPAMATDQAGIEGVTATVEQQATVSYDNAQIHVKGMQCGAIYALYAIDGSEVMRGQTGGTEVTINYTTLAAGHYFLRISTSQATPLVAHILKTR